MESHTRIRASNDSRMGLDTYIATWASLDNPGLNFTTEVVANSTAEAWNGVLANARLSMGVELNRWALEKLERVTLNSRETVA